MDREQVLKSLAVSKTERQTSEFKVFTIMRKLLKISDRKIVGRHGLFGFSSQTH